MIRKAVIAIAITTAIGAAVALAPTIASARGGGGGHGGGGHGGGGHGGGFGGGGGFHGGGFGGGRVGGLHGGSIGSFRGEIGGFHGPAFAGGFRGARLGGFRGSNRSVRVAGFRRRGFPIAAGFGLGGWGYYDSCIVWTGYNWVNICY
jgi:hypothetical protein